MIKASSHDVAIGVCVCVFSIDQSVERDVGVDMFQRQSRGTSSLSKIAGWFNA